MPLPNLSPSPSAQYDRRNARRRTLRLVADGQAGTQVVLHDISATGLLIESATSLAIGDHLQIDLPEAGIVGATIVWANDRFFGCRFNSRLSAAAVSAALLRATPNTAAPEVLAGWDIAQEAPEKPSIVAADSPVPETGRRLPPGIRLAIIVGLSLGLWSLILWAVGWI